MKKKLLLVLFLIILFPFGLYRIVFAQSESEKLQELQKKIEEYSNKVRQLQQTANTLSNQIEQFDTEIAITELKIDQTQEQIVLLGGRLDQLDASMNELEEAFSNRVVQTYKMTRVNDSAMILFSSSDLNKAVSSYHYLHKIQEADNDLLSKLQKAHTLYAEKKDDLEDLEKVLGVQKEQLDDQKNAKSYLLNATKNDEKKYQELLAQTRAEFEAIQAIIAGRGDETEVGHVNQNDQIASIIQGPSCNSSGQHLHFIVSQNGNAQNPFNYLKSVDHQNCSGPGECSSGDPFAPSGSWDWPISPTIKFTQGYGYTWAVQNTWVGRIYQFHNGIDIDSLSNPSVRAVQSGTLYQGSYSGSGGCRLRYVRVDHDNSDLDTFYLHINY